MKSALQITWKKSDRENIKTNSIINNLKKIYIYIHTRYRLWERNGTVSLMDDRGFEKKKKREFYRNTVFLRIDCLSLTASKLDRKKKNASSNEKTTKKKINKTINHWNCKNTKNVNGVPRRATGRKRDANDGQISKKKKKKKNNGNKLKSKRKRIENWERKRERNGIFSKKKKNKNNWHWK